MTLLLNPETLVVVHKGLGIPAGGLILREGKCIYAPPGLREFEGKLDTEISSICAARGWITRSPIEWVVNTMKEGIDGGE